MAAPASSRTRQSIRRNLLAGVVLVTVLALGVGGWAATTDISGAVIASGSLVVDTNVKKVQHLSGGLVGQLLVRDGDRVKEGDILLRLDDTLTRANLSIVTKGLDEMMARKARLEAERDGHEVMTIPRTLLDRITDPKVAHIIDGERRLFEIRRAARNGQKAQLRQRIEQLLEQVVGHTTQERAKAQEVVLIKRELRGAEELWDKNLMPITKLTALQREATRVEGERGQLLASIAQTKGRISETELQIVQVDHDLSSEVGRELRETDAKISEYMERKIAAEDQLRRVDIRAPQNGKVHQSIAHTVGGVITAGEVIMLIVPDSEQLTVEAKVAPQDIDQLWVGQSAIMRFSAFNQRTTPELKGEITRISADTVADQRTGQTYYTIRISTRDTELARLGDVRLAPGMPVEVFVATGDRTVLSFLVKPLQDQIMRAFRER